MIHFSRTGPQKRESSEHSRLSPIMNQWPAGIVIALGKSAGAPPSQRSWMNGSALALAVEDDVAVDDRDRVARAGDDALDEVLAPSAARPGSAHGRALAAAGAALRVLAAAGLVAGRRRPAGGRP